MNSPSAPRPHSAPATDLVYALAADPHWMQAGSTSATGRPELPQRRSTQVDPSVPMNVPLFDLAADHDRNLQALLAKYGSDPMDVPAGRATLATAAAALAEGTPAAAADYELIQLRDGLRAACEAGEGREALGRISCPSCFCWASLVQVRDPSGGWHAACINRDCVTTTGDPSRFTLDRVAEHHLHETAA